MGNADSQRARSAAGEAGDAAEAETSPPGATAAPASPSPSAATSASAFAYAQDEIPLPNTPSVRDLRARFPGVDADTLRRFLRAKRPQQMLTTHLAWKRAELPIDVSPSSSPAAALTKRYVDQGFFTVAASSDPRRLNCVVDGAVLAGLSAEGGYDADAAVRSMLHLLETNMPDGRYGV